LYVVLLQPALRARLDAISKRHAACSGALDVCGPPFSWRPRFKDPSRERIHQKVRIMSSRHAGISSDLSKAAPSGDALIDEEVVDHARHAARDLYRRGKERAVAMEKGFEGVVKDRPVQSVLIAAGIGALIGFLVSRR
jgi:ElaB/YqjD/DUF883 family membrane-anchored ribosome-binding protein